MFIYVHLCSFMFIYVHLCSFMFIYVHLCSFMCFLLETNFKTFVAAVAQLLRALNILRQIWWSTSGWRGFEYRWLYQSGCEFAKAPLLILKHKLILLCVQCCVCCKRCRSELIDSACVVIVSGKRCIKNIENNKDKIFLLKYPD